MRVYISRTRTRATQAAAAATFGEIRMLTSTAACIMMHNAFSGPTEGFLSPGTRSRHRFSVSLGKNSRAPGASVKISGLITLKDLRRAIH